MGRLADDTAVREMGEHFVAELAEDWGIWGPNGGYMAAIALRAAGRRTAQGHRPASFSCQYLASPAFGPAELTVEPVRMGRSAGRFAVDLRQGDKLCLQAQVATVAAGDGPVFRAITAPDVPPPEALPPIEALMPPGATKHPFWVHFDSRAVRFVAHGEPNPTPGYNQSWQRLYDFDAQDDPFLDAARALVLIDTMPWPTFSRTTPEPPDFIAPSLDLTVWFHEPALDSDWLLTDAYADLATGGLIHGGGRVWTRDGRLMARGGSQLMVVRR